MKKLLSYSCLILSIAGCSKPASPETLQNEGNPTETSQVSNTPTNNDSPATNTPVTSPSAPTSSTTPAKAPERLPSSEARVLPSNTQPHKAQPPAENPAAKPPQSGEKVANDFKITAGDRTVEIEGICRLTEDEAICWKPNGDSNKPLADELTNAMKSRDDEYSNTYRVKFLKKNRVLVLKTTIPPTRGGRGFSGSYGLMNDYSGSSSFQERWDNNGSNIFNNTNSSGFDNTRIERQVLTGAFEKSTKTFPVRYHLTEQNNPPTSVPFTKGRFTVDGNTYEIVSISDKPEGNMSAMSYGGPPNQQPQKMTFLKIKSIEIRNPNTIIHISPADASGSPYVGYNAKGEPLNAQDHQRLQQEEQKKMMEDMQKGITRNMNTWNRGYIGAVTLDPNSNRGRMEGIIVGQLNLDSSRIKKLVLNYSRRTVYVFDKIRLDPN